MQKEVLQKTGLRQEPEWLQAYKQKNLKIMEKLPIKKSKHTDSEGTWKKAREIETRENSIKIREKNIEVLSWKQALEENGEAVRKALESEAMPAERTEALANAFFSDGFVAIIQKNFSVKELAEIEMHFHENVVAKNLIIFEEDSQARILEKISGNMEIVMNETIIAGRNSEAAFCRMHQNNAFAVLAQQAILEKDARLLNANAWISGKRTKSSTLNALNGQGATLQQIDILFGNQKQEFDLSLQNLHSATDASSHSLFKAVLEQEAKSIFDGMIKILPAGQRANALLEAHSMLLGEKSSSNNIPGLEIEADDVKATHSASVAQLEQEHLFYLESKGIGTKKAKHLVTAGFLEGCILRMPEQFHSPIMEELEKTIDGGEE